MSARDDQLDGMATKRARRAGAALLAVALSCSSLAGCYTFEPTSVPTAQDERPSRVRLKTFEGLYVELTRVKIDDESVRGMVVDCYGDEDQTSEEAAPEAAVISSSSSAPLQWLPGQPCPRYRTHIVIPRSRIDELEAEELDGAATAGVVIAPVLGAALVVGTVLLVAASGTGVNMGRGGSCPRVYSFDGSDWRLDSGTYGSAFYQAGQQTDHDLLEHLAVVDGHYRLQLRNELDELEHVDALRLRVIDHPAGSWVVPAPSGDLLTFRAPKPPLEASDLRGVDAREQVAERDGRLWQSDLSGRDPERPADTRDGLVLVFPKPAGAREAKLWLTGTNTRWAGELMRYLMAVQGDRLPQIYQQLNESVLARKLMRRLLAGVGLMRVQVRTPAGWSERGIFEAAGNEIAKDQALRIDVADIPGDRLEVRLESATAMWTIDRVAVDYGADVELDVRQLPRGQATSHDGHDLSALLASDDGERHTFETGDWVELVFAAPPPPATGKQRSIVVVTTGYDTLHVSPLHDADPIDAQHLLLSPDATSRRSLELLLQDAASAGP